MPSFWTDQALFLRDGFLMGFGLEFIFLYFNAYESMTRKATVKCLDRVRQTDYKRRERVKLNEIREEKRRKLERLREIAEEKDKGEGMFKDGLKR